MGPDADRDGGRSTRGCASSGVAGPAGRRRLGHAVPAGDQPVHHDDDDRREVRRHDDPGRPRDDAGEPRRRRAADRGAGRPRSRTSCAAIRRSTRSDDDDVARVAAAAELEHHPAGTTIFSQGAEPVSHLRVVRSGAVELVLDGRDARPARRRRALRAGLDAVGPAHRLHRARARGHDLLLRIPADVARADCSAGPRRCATCRARCWTAGAWRQAARAGAPTRPTSRSQALVRRPLVVCAPRHDDPRRRRSG